MPKNQPEFILQKQICQWLSIQHPDVLFLSDTVASVKLTMPQAIRNKSIQKEGFKTTDLIILFPNNSHYGLFLELKIKSPFKKDGTLFKNKHLEAQQESIKKLNKIGYFARFSWGFEMTKIIIESYLKNK